MMNPIRNGNFTSSEIVALTKNGKAKDSWAAPVFTYIEECNMERRLGRALENEIDARPTSWGKLLEPHSFDKLGLEYELCSHKTFIHPEIHFWMGSPDALKGAHTVADHKCPMTLKSFCQLVDPYYENGKEVHPALSIEAVRANHKDGDKYFYQLVSNACITDSKIGELIVYVPYKSELDAIRKLASSAGELGEYTKWVYYASDEQLPHLIDGGYYKDLNIIQFDILDSDKNFLTKRVKECGEFLQPYPKLITA